MINTTQNTSLCVGIHCKTYICSVFHCTIFERRIHDCSIKHFYFCQFSLGVPTYVSACLSKVSRMVPIWNFTFWTIHILIWRFYHSEIYWEFDHLFMILAVLSIWSVSWTILFSKLALLSITTFLKVPLFISLFFPIFYDNSLNFLSFCSTVLFSLLNLSFRRLLTILFLDIFWSF